jgi:hypothetical protein
MPCNADRLFNDGNDAVGLLGMFMDEFLPLFFLLLRISIEAVYEYL